MFRTFFNTLWPLWNLEVFWTELAVLAETLSYQSCLSSWGRPYKPDCAIYAFPKSPQRLVKKEFHSTSFIRKHFWLINPVGGEKVQKLGNICAKDKAGTFDFQPAKHCKSFQPVLEIYFSPISSFSVKISVFFFWSLNKVCSMSVLKNFDKM